MKVQRHNIPRNTVRELSSAAAAQITPREAANVQLAKTGAIAAGLGAASQIAVTVDEVRQRARGADDEITYKINENNLTNAYKQLQNDPNLEKEVQDDGTSTAEYFQRESDAIFKNLQGWHQGYKRPKNT